MTRWLHAVALALTVTTLCAVACTGTTAGELVPITVRLEPRPSEARFTTSTGWEVELAEARIAIGPLYVYAPAEGAWLAPLSVARAHGGVDPLNGRIVRAEWLGQVAFDPLGDAPTDLGRVEAEAGDADAVTLVLDPLDALRGHHAWVAGLARKDGEAIAFEGGLDIPDEGLARRVEDIPLGVELSRDGVLSIAVRPSRWLDGADFGRLSPAAGAGPRVITADGQVHNAWYLGARSPRAFEARFDEGDME